MELRFLNDDPDADRWRVVDERGDEVGEIWWAGQGFAWQTFVPPAPTEAEARRRAEITQREMERVYADLGTPITVEVREREVGNWEWLVLYRRRLPTRDAALEELRAGVLATRSWKRNMEG